MLFHFLLLGKNTRRNVFGNVWIILPRIMRHLQFICYRVLPPGCWPSGGACLFLGAAQPCQDHLHQGPVECEGPDDQPRLRVQGGMWKFSSKCQEPRWCEFRDSVCTMFTQRSQPLAPSVDISNVFTLCTSKDEWNCSSAAVYTVQLFPSLPCSQRVEFRQPCLIHNARNDFLSSPPAVSHSGVFSSHHSQAFLHPLPPNLEEQAQKKSAVRS